MIGRREVIARKRIERAQDRDGLHIDLSDIAELLRDFSQKHVCFRESSRCESDSFSGSETDDSSSNSTASPEVKASVQCQVDEVEVPASGMELLNIGDSSHHPGQQSNQEELKASNEFENEQIHLPPLSGENLKTAKKIAGYLRLQWTEQGHGRCRSLLIQIKAGPQAPSNEDAVRALLAKYKKMENGAATKRLPTERCLPQQPGTQVQVFCS